MSEQPKEIFIRNKQRELQSKLGNRHESYYPEHERLNRTPEFADGRKATQEGRQLAADFRYARRHPLVVGSPSGKKKDAPRKVQSHGAIASGHNKELSWIPRDIPNYNANPNEEVVGYDDIPEPPQVPPMPEPEPEYIMEPDPDPAPYERPSAVRIDDIAEGNYFVVVMDSIIAEAPELEVIEGFVEQMIFDSKNNIVLDDIVVLQKMKIRVGVNVN